MVCIDLHVYLVTKFLDDWHIFQVFEHHVFQTIGLLKKNKHGWF